EHARPPRPGDTGMARVTEPLVEHPRQAPGATPHRETEPTEPGRRTGDGGDTETDGDQLLPGAPPPARRCASLSATASAIRSVTAAAIASTSTPPVASLASSAAIRSVSRRSTAATLSR